MMGTDIDGDVLVYLDVAQVEGFSSFISTIFKTLDMLNTLFDKDVKTVF